MSYTFRVGVKDLNMRKSDIKKGTRNPEEKNTIGEMLRKNGYNHACLLLNEDLFEYGANKEKSYERHKNVGRDTSFDWNELGEAMNGTTDVSPDQLEEAIIKEKEWDKGHYKVLKHNCHDFVKFCLKKIGCKECLTNNETFLKICYDRKKIKNTVKIRSALGKKNLDCKEYNIKNETEIILKYDYDYGSDSQILCLFIIMMEQLLLQRKDMIMNMLLMFNGVKQKVELLSIYGKKMVQKLKRFFYMNMDNMYL